MTSTSTNHDLTHTHPQTGAVASVRIGDCREQLMKFDEVKNASVDLVFADPPFNWARDYDRHKTGDAWDDSSMSRQEYLDFTYEWLDLCSNALTPTGSMWVNIPDDSAAEIVVHLKKTMHMVNWCVWHYRFGQNTKGRFINSKVHALYFAKDLNNRTWNADPILEESDRRAIYSDPRTESKRDGLPAGMRVPMDVWYGKFWGRIQGNNKERRAKHDNQLPEVYLQRVIACSSNPGDTVLDPFLGSGTTGVVAHAMDRHFIGTEFSRPNAEMAFERLKDGPIRELGALRGESSAIHENRKKTPPSTISKSNSTKKTTKKAKSKTEKITKTKSKKKTKAKTKQQA
jgi:DNA modification methylase